MYMLGIGITNIVIYTIFKNDLDLAILKLNKQNIFSSRKNIFNLYIFIK